ncbi:hypothetical protein ACX0HA_08985 [Flavobacterium hauense]
MTTKASAETAPKNTDVKAPQIGKNLPNEGEKLINALLTPTAEQRIKSLKNLKLLTERFEFLKTKEDELNTFCVSSDSTQEKIKLTNGSGFIFTISNSQVIEDVIALISKHISTKISHTEKEIIEFPI